MRTCRPLLLLATLAIAVVGSTVAESARAAEPRRPNVLFIASDDMNTQLGVYGHALVATPHLAELARRGVLFERAYCQYPLCNPSRSSVLSGLRPDTTHVYDNALKVRDLVPGLVTLPQLFRQAGYAALRVGKLYHYGVPGQIGTSGLDDAESWDRVENPKGRDKLDESQVENLTPNRGLGASLAFLAAGGTDAEQTDALVADAAIRFLDEYRERPFFLAVGFFRPHVPCIAPRERFERFPLERIVLPTGDVAGRQGKPPLAFQDESANYGLAEADLKRFVQGYYAALTLVDAQVGRLLAALDERGLNENTIVVFWSDHGFHLGEHGAWQKQSLYEESARVPLIVAAPGRRGTGQRSRALVELVDLYPTLAELAGLTPPATIEGTSLVPLLDEPERAWKRGAFTQVRRPHLRGARPEGVMGRAVRTERFRYVEWGDGRQGVELYDHNADPGETTNRATDPALAEVQTQLRQLLTAGWRQARPAE